MNTKIMFAHRSAYNAEQIQKLALQIAKAHPVKEAADFIPASTYVPGLRKQGLFDRWIAVVTRDMDEFIITTLHVGKATMKLANIMKVKGKKVRFWNGLELKDVKFIKTVDETNWKSGWMVVYG